MWDRKHFLTISDLDADDVCRIIAEGINLKHRHHERTLEARLAGRSMAMVFLKPSLRTRMSFELAVTGMGGTALYISDEEIKLGRREAVGDVARVMSRYVDIIMIRTFEQGQVEELAAHASVPVINGLTDMYHPCQILGDAMTVVERKGELTGRRVAYLGDGNNVANSWVNLASKLDFHLVLAVVEGYEPDRGFLDGARKNGARVDVVYDPEEAVKEADVVYTDVWASMGQEEQKEKRQKAMSNLQVNDRLLSHARPDAMVLHCLPAHRGEEITDSVMDGDHSAVFDQAENRLHIQRSIILELLER
jgi:ornithine carbamoyltransferase